jgi:transcription elongation GreA/GreB family factor
MVGPRRAAPATTMEMGMSSDPTAKPAASRWTCANCNAPFAWAPVVFLGLPFCCSGCAASGPCMCTYEAAERSRAVLGAAIGSRDVGPRPPVPMAADIRARLARDVEHLSALVAGAGRRAREAGVRGPTGGAQTPRGATGEGLAERLERLLVLEDILARARVPELDGQAVVGSRVKVYDGGDRILTYRIVLPQDADPGSGRIAPDSPMGRALLGAQAGDAVEVLMSGVARTLLLVDVRYREEAVAEAPGSRALAGPEREARVVASLPSRA